MHALQDSMWREIWKILQIFLETKQGSSKVDKCFMHAPQDSMWREIWKILQFF